MPFELDGKTPPIPGPECPVDCTISTLGSRAAMLLLRQAFYGDRRFEAFVQHTGISEATVAKRLQELVDAGVFAKHPYREPGSRIRHEYALTAAGEELLPVVIGLFNWGRAHLDGAASELSLVGPDGRPVSVGIHSAGGQALTAGDIRVQSAGSRGRKR